MSVHRSCHVTLKMQVLILEQDEVNLRSPMAEFGATYQESHHEVSLTFELPEPGEESIEEVILEEALAAAMQKRQGENYE